MKAVGETALAKRTVTRPLLPAKAQHRPKGGEDSPPHRACMITSGRCTLGAGVSSVKGRGSGRAASAGERDDTEDCSHCRVEAPALVVAPTAGSGVAAEAGVAFAAML